MITENVPAKFQVKIVVSSVIMASLGFAVKISKVAFTQWGDY